MAIDIDTAFVSQFESEVHMAYQRMGSKLRNTVRNKSNITGKDTTFQIVGKGTAGTKSRHGNVPVMSLDHTNVTVTLEDYYAADYIDKLDELKINHDERMVVAQSAAGALGRKTDSLITEAMAAATNVTATPAGSITLPKATAAREHFDTNDVPDDGDRYAAVSPKAWTGLMALNEFSNADYVGTDELPYSSGMTAKRWNGFMWFIFSGLNATANVRDNFLYHKTAVGHASGAEVTSHMDWVAEKAAHLNNNYMSQGAVLIDQVGIYNLKTTEA